MSSPHFSSPGYLAPGGRPGYNGFVIISWSSKDAPIAMLTHSVSLTATGTSVISSSATPSKGSSVSATTTASPTGTSTPASGNGALLFLSTASLGDESTCTGDTMSAWNNSAPTSANVPDPSLYSVSAVDGTHPKSFWDVPTGRCVARFSSSCSRLKTMGVSLQSAFTAIIVARLVNGGTGNAVLGDQNSYSAFGWYGGRQDSWLRSSSWIVQGTPQTHGVWETYTWTRDVSGTTQMYKDATLLISSTYYSSTQFILGGMGSSWNYCSDVDVGAFLVYNDILSSSDLQNVLSSLAVAFSPSTTPTPSSSTTPTVSSTASLSKGASSSTSVSPSFTVTPSQAPGAGALLYLSSSSLGDASSCVTGAAFLKWNNSAPATAHVSDPSAYSVNAVDSARPTTFFDASTGQCVARFSSSCSRLRTSDVLSSNAYTIIITARLLPGVNNVVLADQQYGFTVFGWFGGQQNAFYSNNYGWFLQGPPSTNNIWTTYAWMRDSNGLTTMYRDSLFLASTYYQSGSTQLVLGGLSPSWWGYCSDADVGALLVYDYALSTAELENVIVPLNAKFTATTTPVSSPTASPLVTPTSSWSNGASISSTPSATPSSAPGAGALLYLTAQSLGNASACDPGSPILSWVNSAPVTANAPAPSSYGVNKIDGNPPVRFWDPMTGQCVARFKSNPCSRLSTFGPFSQTSQTIIVVARMVTGGTSKVALGDSGDGALGWANGFQDAWVKPWQGYIFSSNIPAKQGVWMMYAFTRSSTSGVSKMYRDNFLLASTTSYYFPSTFYIGGSGYNSYCSDVDVGSLLIYDYELSILELENLVVALAVQFTATNTPVSSATSTRSPTSTASWSTGASLPPSVTATPSQAPGAGALLYLSTASLGNSSTCTGAAISTWANSAPITAHVPDPSLYSVGALDGARPKTFWDAPTGQCVARFSSSCSRLAAYGVNVQSSSRSVIIVARMIGSSGVVLGDQGHYSAFGWLNGRENSWYEDSGWLLQGPNLQPGTWIMYSWVRDSAGLTQMYRGTTLLSSSTYNSGSAQPVFGGMGNSWGSCSDADIGAFFFYDYALSVSSLQNLDAKFSKAFSSTPTPSSTQSTTSSLSPSASLSAGASPSPSFTPTQTQVRGSGALLALTSLGNESTCISGTSFLEWPNSAPASAAVPNPGAYSVYSYDVMKPTKFWDASTGQCVARFSGSCSRFATSGLYLRNSPYTMVIVARIIGDNKRFVLADESLYENYGWEQGQQDTWRTNQAQFQRGSAAVSNDWIMYTFTRDAAGFATMYKFGDVLFKTTALGPTKLLLGGGYWIYCSDVDIGTFLVYDHALTQTEVQTTMLSLGFGFSPTPSWSPTSTSSPTPTSSNTPSISSSQTASSTPTLPPNCAARFRPILCHILDGEYLAVISNLPSEHLCQLEVCRGGTPGATAYSFSASTGTCWLMSNATTKLLDTSVNSGVLWSAAPPSPSTAS